MIATFYSRNTESVFFKEGNIKMFIMDLIYAFFKERYKIMKDQTRHFTRPSQEQSCWIGKVCSTGYKTGARPTLLCRRVARLPKGSSRASLCTSAVSCWGLASQGFQALVNPSADLCGLVGWTPTVEYVVWGRFHCSWSLKMYTPTVASLAK